MKRTTLLILFVLLFALAAPVMAQDAPPEPVPLMPLIVSILTPIIAALTGYANSPVVTTFTGLLKHPFPNLNPRYVQIGLSAGLTIAFGIAVTVGWEVRLQTFLDALVAFTSAAMGLGGVLVGSSQAYQAASNRGVPVLGYKPESTNTPHVTAQG